MSDLGPVDCGPSLSADVVERYLRLLGVPRRPPRLEGLEELVGAHLWRVPFENISKLYRRRHEDLCGLPGIERFLDGIERFHFGGTCYATNYHLCRLLASLGYDARLCGADMSQPDVHLVTVVALEGREYLVDVGYAAPFTRPLPRHLPEDQVIRWGSDHYVLKPPDTAGRSRMELYRDGEHVHGYVVRPEPRRIEEFEAVIADSFRDEATFMNAILLARFSSHRSRVIHNLTVMDYLGTECRTRTLEAPEDLARVVEEGFGIPEGITREVVADLPSLGNAWR